LHDSTNSEDNSIATTIILFFIKVTFITLKSNPHLQCRQQKDFEQQRTLKNDSAVIDWTAKDSRQTVHSEKNVLEMQLIGQLQLF
jgi:hypothetical protein